MPDNLTKKQRRYCMSSIPSSETSLEIRITKQLDKLEVEYKKNDSNLPGSPDIVFWGVKTAVFIDGDFWHGWQYSRWKNKVSSYWQKKIENNRRRDKRNFLRLRRMGWSVKRFWGHQIKKFPDEVLSLILDFQSKSN